MIFAPPIVCSPRIFLLLLVWSLQTGRAERQGAMKLSGKSIQRLTREELLKTRLCDLPVSLDVTWFQWARGVVESQLRRRHILLKPHYWISDEWFCPDGVPGVAVPFFLLHPRLLQLEKQMMGFVDGSTPLKRLKILRHELGHAMDNAYRLRSLGGAERRRIFGDSRVPYPECYEPKLYSRSYVRHLESGYAQSHPDEDFAETFAVWLQPKRQWRIRYQGTPALEKLEFLNRVMKNLQGISPTLTNTWRVDPLEKNPMTLGQYYRKKRRAHGIVGDREHGPEVFLRRLEKTAGGGKAVSEPQLELHHFLHRHSGLVLSNSSKALGAPRYQLEPLFKKYLKTARQQGLKITVSDEDQFRQKISELFTGEARKFLSEGGTRIRM